MTILLILVVLILLLLALSYFAFCRMVLRLPEQPADTVAKWLLPFKDEILSGSAWFQAQSPERVSIRSRDGLRLSGWLLPAENAKGTVLMLHGYRSHPFRDFGAVFPFYHDLGWNVLAVCQRACGESEGKYITYGVKERFDARDWAVFLADRFGEDHTIVLHGLSMGSTTALMALGTELPENVRGVVADCGFTSPYDILAHVVRSDYHLPAKPLLALTGIYTKLFADFGLRDYSTQEALRENQRPIFLLHGEADSFVPIRATVENYAASAGEKKLLTIPGADHAAAWCTAPEECQRNIRKFLERL